MSLAGAGLALLGFGFGLLLLVLRLVFGAQWAGDGLFVLFAVLFFFSGVQLLGMGMLGEYLGRVYDDVRARPRFFIERIARGAGAPALPPPAAAETATHPTTPSCCTPPSCGS